MGSVIIEADVEIIEMLAVGEAIRQILSNFQASAICKAVKIVPPAITRDIVLVNRLIVDGLPRSRCPCAALCEHLVGGRD